MNEHASANANKDRVSQPAKPLAPDLSTPEMPVPLPAALSLQRAVGNRAVQSLIQRLPSPTIVKSQQGEPKANITILGKVLKVNSTHYRAVLDALQTYNTFVTTAKVTLDSVSVLKGILDKVEDAINFYLSRRPSPEIEGDKRFAFMNQLMAQVMTERSKIGILAYRMHKNRPSEVPTWHIVLSQPSQVNIIADSQIVGSDKGGTNQVAKVNQFGREGYFKPNQNAVPLTENMDQLTTDDMQYSDIANMTENFKGMDFNAVTNSYNVPADAGIFDENALQSYQKQHPDELEIDMNLNTSMRDVATARLDELLGSNLIARAELAFRKTGNGELIQGSLMESAQGMTISKLNYDISSNKDTSKPQRDFMNDAGLQRFLSRLQLLDALAGQVDRNMSNFTLQLDNSGNIVGLTGIDNDMSFGAHRESVGRVFNFPGISKFVDKDMADRIIGLDEKMLRVVMTGVLSDAEIDTLIKRLTKLKTYLADLKGKNQLLTPSQWDAATAQGLLDENSSYFAYAQNKLVRK
ncbi:hypothetical protein VZO05_12945 [Aggregatilineales bacterium SYSU G02658]